MADAYRAVRQFERMMGHSYEELMQPRTPPLSVREQEGRLICSIIFTPIYDSKGKLIDMKITYERPGDSPD